MMEQDGHMDFNSLKTWFQGPNGLKIQPKPALPSKPKTLPPPQKISNPLVSSLQKGALAPRVVFKEEKSPTRQISPPWGSKTKGTKPVNDTEIKTKNKNQQKGVDIKKSLKERNLPLVLPVGPVKPETPKPELSPFTPASASPVKAAIPSPKFDFTPQNAAENEKTDTVEICTQDSTCSTSSVPSSNSSTKSHLQTSEADDLEQTSTKTPLVLSIPAASIPTPGIPTSATSAVEIAKPVIPASEAVPAPEAFSAESSLSTTPEPEALKPITRLLNLSEVFPPPSESPPPEFTDIPPPLILEEDFPDESFSDAPKSSPTDLAPLTPDSSSIVSSKTSPVLSNCPPISSEPTARLTEHTPDPDPATTFSPPDLVLENPHENTLSNKAENADDQKEDLSLSKPLLSLSVLERAEEMASVKWAPHDNRIFNLLERSKRKTTVGNLAEHAEPVETVPAESKAEEPPPEIAEAQQVSTVSTFPDEAPALEEDVPELPPVDYVDPNPPEPSQTNGQDHRTSPGTLKVVKPMNPPPPPPRKPLLSTSLEESPSQPPSNHHVSTPAEPNAAHELSFYDTSIEEASFADVEEPEAAVVLNESPATPIPSVHEEAFLKHSVQRQNSNVHIVSNLDDRVEVDSGFVNATKSEAQAGCLQDTSALSSGTNENSENVYEDYTENKKAKNSKKSKKPKGPPQNPYADTTASADTNKKSFFSRKNSGKVADDKELKKKEKQREKEKEKEKERERKEQKEREKKENEMKKKFKITGQEAPIYQVKVIGDHKGRKDDLTVKVGDTVSIVRANNCPKGKWLAKDSTNKYGYVPVECVDLNINGILELGKMTKASNRANGHKEGEITSTDSRVSEQCALSQESFSDESEEWMCDDDEPASMSPTEHLEMNQTPRATPVQDAEQEPMADGDYQTIPENQKALQKLAVFFTQPSQPPLLNSSPVLHEHTSDEELVSSNGADIGIADLQLLPPPDQYADNNSMPIYSKPNKLASK